MKESQSTMYHFNRYLSGMLPLVGVLVLFIIGCESKQQKPINKVNTQPPIERQKQNGRKTLEHDTTDGNESNDKNKVSSYSMNRSSSPEQIQRRQDRKKTIVFDENDTINSAKKNDISTESEKQKAARTKEDSDEEESMISLNFNQVDIRVMLKTIGDITGTNFVIDDSVQGTVTLVSPKKIKLNEIYDVLESVLEVKGYAAIRSSKDVVKVVPRSKAAHHSLDVRIGSDPALIPNTDTVVTQIIPLKYADAEEVSLIIRPLLSTGANMATYLRTNSILITDTSANIHHAAKIIQKLDVKGSKEQVTVIRLEYASANILSEQISIILEKEMQSGGSARARGRNEIRPHIRILPDERTNSLIIVANESDTNKIDQLIQELDVERPHKSNNVHVIYLKNAQAPETAKSLNDALTNMKIAGTLTNGQNIQVTADEGTNSLIVTASAQDFEVISEIAEKLDIVREQVLVELFIVEVSEDNLREIGVDWATLDEAVSDSVRAFASTNFGTRTDFLSGELEGLSVGAWEGPSSDVSIGAILHALEKESGLNILSTPSIVTSNHNKAKIIVGENRPFVVESRITETDPSTPTVIKTFEYKDVGISLEITPHISQNQMVRVEIQSEFSKLVEDVTTSADTPTTAQREAQTVVSMRSGATVVIGGLIRDDRSIVEKKIPLIGDLPIVGGLFKFQQEQLEKTNLLIFLTPYVINTQDDYDELTENKRTEMKKASAGSYNIEDDAY